MLYLSKSFLLLGTFLALWLFPAWSQTVNNEKPSLVVSVYDDAGVRANVLAHAEREAAKIFNLAGVEVAWQNCPASASSTNHVGPDAPVRAEEQSLPSPLFEKTANIRPAFPMPDCGQFEWPIHLALRIVPRSSNTKHEVFGEAFLSAEGTGCYSDVFYDRAAGLNAEWHVSLDDILGNVIAHELGHLLLGSNSHTADGIMRARWQGKELRQAGLFNAEQAKRMRGRLRAGIPGLMVATRASY